VHLEVCNGTPELLALLRILKGAVKRSLCDPDCHRSDSDPASVKRHEELAEAVTVLSKQVFLRDTDILQYKLCRIGGIQPHLFIIIDHLEAFRIRRDDNGGNLFFSVVRTGNGGECEMFGM